MKKTIPHQLNVDAVRIAGYLAGITHHEPITKAELNALVPGRDLFGKDRYVLAAGIRKCLRETGKFFGAIWGVGIKLLTPEEHAVRGHGVVRKVNRYSRRETRILLSADTAKMSNADLKKYSVALGLLGGLTHLTATRTVKEIEAGAELKPNLTALDVQKIGLASITNSQQ